MIPARDDGLGCFRGCMNMVLPSLVMWLIVGAVAARLAGFDVSVWGAGVVL